MAVGVAALATAKAMAAAQASKAAQTALTGRKRRAVRTKPERFRCDRRPDYGAIEAQKECWSRMGHDGPLRGM